LENVDKPVTEATDNVVEPDTVALDVTTKFPPILQFLPIPIPPDTNNAPVVELVDSDVFSNVYTPLVVKLPSKFTVPDNVVVAATVKFPPILTDFTNAPPPFTIRAPFAVLDESVVLVIVVKPAIVMEEFAEIGPERIEDAVTDKFAPILQLFAIPSPPKVFIEPVDIFEESVISFIVNLPVVVNPVIVTALTNVEVPYVVKFPPRFNDFATDIPPGVINDPVIVFIESAVPVNVMELVFIEVAAVSVPPTEILPVVITLVQYTPFTAVIPPDTTNAAEEDEVASVVFVIRNKPDAVTIPIDEIFPENTAEEFTFNDPPIYIDCDTPIPPENTTDPVVGLAEFVF